MGSVPTLQLTEAVAALPEADRALVNLWINRGLDDARLAALTGMDPRTVRMRRERIITDLGAVLELSKGELLVALRTMSLPPPETVEALPAPEAEPAAPAPAPEAEPPAPEAEDQPVAPVAEDEPVAVPRRRRIRLAGAVTAVAAVIAALLIVLLSSNGSAPRAAVRDPPTSDPGPATAPAVTSTATSTPDGTPSNPAQTRPTLGAFKGLPGGVIGASGHVTLLGHGRDLRLELTVNHLPGPRHGGHYEAWLYTTVLDSRALGRVNPGHTATYRLPSGARRFRFIDVSFQPRGVVNHSGESRLRTTNPVRALRRHPGAPKARARHVLHPASLAHPIRTRSHHQARRRSAVRHAGHHHAGRRAAARHAGHHHAQRRGSDSRARSTR